MSRDNMNTSDFTGGAGARGPASNTGATSGASSGSTSGSTSGSSGSFGASGSSDWNTEDSFWRGSYSSRPYARTDRGYDYYRPAYQYGFQSATTTHRGRQWNEVENDLERGWDKAKGESKGIWADVKHAVRDAWDRVTGHTDRGAKNEISRDINKGTTY